MNLSILELKRFFPQGHQRERHPNHFQVYHVIPFRLLKANYTGMHIIFIPITKSNVAKSSALQ